MEKTEIDKIPALITIRTTAGKVATFNDLAKRFNISRRELFEEMLSHCVENNAIKGKKTTKKEGKSNIDYKKIILKAWENGNGIINGNGEKIITIQDVEAYFIKIGKTEKTARQYARKKVPQNPIFAGLLEGWLLKENNFYIINIKQYKTKNELQKAMTADDFEKLFFMIEEKYSINDLLNMTTEQRDKVYVETYYNDFK